MTDGPSINVYDALAWACWVLATGLILYDTFAHEGHGMGPFTPFGGLVALIAVVLTLGGIVRRAKDEIIAQLGNAFELGRESVLREMRR